MKIHEYQAKEILRKFGVVTPRGIACHSVEEAEKAANNLGGHVWVVKAQIHAGGRGKGVLFRRGEVVRSVSGGHEVLLTALLEEIDIFLRERAENPAEPAQPERKKFF